MNAPLRWGRVRWAELSLPGGGAIPPSSWSPHLRTSSAARTEGSRPPPPPPPPSSVSPSSRPGAPGAASAAGRDGASAPALDRRVGRDVPAHLHPPRDGRAAEAGDPGRRGKCLPCRMRAVPGVPHTPHTTPARIWCLNWLLLLSLPPNEAQWRHQSSCSSMAPISEGN